MLGELWSLNVKQEYSHATAAQLALLIAGALCTAFSFPFIVRLFLSLHKKTKEAQWHTHDYFYDKLTVKLFFITLKQTLP